MYDGHELCKKNVFFLSRIIHTNHIKVWVPGAKYRSRWKQLVSQAMVANDHTWSAEKKKIP